MGHVYTIERSEPSPVRCDCCGGLIVRLTRFVYRDDNAFAVYYTTYTNHAPSRELAMLVSLGAWGEGATPDQRVAFYCRVRATDESYEVMLDDASESVWKDAEIVGRKLSAEEARRHGWKATAFEVLDEGFRQDPPLHGFLRRVRCGNAGVPLEQTFQLPDDAWALGDARQTRVKVDGSFAALDGQRYFVRALLPISVEGYGSWCVGLWVEVSNDDYVHAADVWEDPEEYARLRFTGTIANDATDVLDLPIKLGAPVELHVSDANERPKILVPRDGELANLMANTWSKPTFEAYAIERGFL